MTLEEFMNAKTDQLTRFNNYAQTHISSAVECGDWANLFKLWCLMDKNQVSEEDMSRVMHSTVGGWWNP